MPTYALTAINVGSFALGESDKILTLFSAERGLTRAVAKGARKPGAKIAGRAELLCVNNLMLATGRSLDIITQAEGIESFSKLRGSLNKLSYGLYYAELTSQFGQGLTEESGLYFERLCQALRVQAESDSDGALACLEFELSVLDLIGYRPELDVCVGCRRMLVDHDLSVFDHDAGGVLCQNCFRRDRRQNINLISEAEHPFEDSYLVQERSFTTHLTPLVWKRLVLAQNAISVSGTETLSPLTARATKAARHLIQTYIEHRAGKKLKALDLINSD